jgi:hypothetical protein
VVLAVSACGVTIDEVPREQRSGDDLIVFPFVIDSGCVS